VLFCTPPHARATGWYRLKDVGEGRTRVDFHEEFQMESRWLAALIEGHIHRYLSKDNDVNLKGIIENGLAARRRAAVWPDSMTMKSEDRE
jgi:hypothetical protein